MVDEISAIELVSYYYNHIKNPCKTEQGLDIRYFWVDEAKKLLNLDKVNNDPLAKSLLEGIIDIYL